MSEVGTTAMLVLLLSGTWKYKNCIEQ